MPRARILIVTAVTAERDAVVAGLEPARKRHPGPEEEEGPAQGREQGPKQGREQGPEQGREQGPEQDQEQGQKQGPAQGVRTADADVIAAGVGPAAAAARTASALTTAAVAGTPFALVVSAGIAGGFGQPLGGTVVASSIVAADLGADTPDGFMSVADLGFGRAEHRPPPALVRDVADATGAAAGAVLTVSTVTGTAARARELAARHPGAVAEAMEGFGVAEAAAVHGVPMMELRAVSNPVGPRDRAAWRVPEALAALGTGCAAMLPVLRAWES